MKRTGSFSSFWTLHCINLLQSALRVPLDIFMQLLLILQLSWSKSASTSIDRHLLLIRKLRSNVSSKIRVSILSSLTKSIPVVKGVKKGCVFAPLLFDLVIKDIIKRLLDPDLFPPCFGPQKISVLLYTDGMVLPSHIYLRRSLSSLSNYSSQTSQLTGIEISTILGSLVAPFLGSFI